MKTVRFLLAAFTFPAWIFVFFLIIVLLTAFELGGYLGEIFVNIEEILTEQWSVWSRKYWKIKPEEDSSF